MDSPALPAVLTGAPSPAFPVRKTGAAVRFSLRFHAGMVRREASGARCEPATGDVRSAQARLTPVGPVADTLAIPVPCPPTAGRFHTGTFHTGTGVRQEIAGLHTATDRFLYPGNFSPVFFPEFPEKSGRDRLAAYRPHSQPYRRFYPLRIWSGFMRCYQWVENPRS